MIQCLFAATMLFALVGCAVEPNGFQPVPPEIQTELDENREKWKSHGITDYRMRIRRVCFCRRDALRPLIVEVRQGAVVAAAYADDGSSVSSDEIEWLPAIDDMFDMIQVAIDSESVDIHTSYNPEFGYPNYTGLSHRFIMDADENFEIEHLYLDMG